MEDKDQAAREVRTTNEQVGNTNVQRQVVTERSSVPASIVAERIIMYITGLIVTLLVVRIVLQILGANSENDFVNFIYSLSGFFAAPFFGMFSYQPSYGVSYFEVSTAVAAVVYGLVGWGLAKLATIGSNRA